MKNNKINSLSFINFIFCMFPISFILGNFAINFTTLILCFFSAVIYKKKIIQINFNIWDKILFLTFLYILFVLILNYFKFLFYNKFFDIITIIKTLSFYRYLILYIVLRFLFSKKIINTYLFYIVSSICVSIISLDIFIQFFTGKNIIGIVSTSANHNSSFFGEELIAGGYIQKFSLFAFFLPFFLKYNISRLILIQFFFFNFFLIAIILSGNRMPLILYLFSIIIFFIMSNDLKKLFFKFILTILITLIILFNTNTKFNLHSKNFFYNSKNIITTFFYSNVESKTDHELHQPYIVPFNCGINTIKKNPIFGGGLKSFRSVPGCITHPHNYYLEILSDIGIVGLILVLSLVYGLLFNLFKKNFNNLKYSNKKLIQICPPFLILLMEFFPIRSSGSFFSTNNATIIFIMLAFIIAWTSNNSKNI